MSQYMPFAAFFAACGFAAPCFGQFDFTQMDFQAQYQQWAHGQNQQMAMHQHQIADEVMRLPECQAMYRQHLAQGGQLTYQQFAVEFAYRGRMTPQGMRQFQATRSQIEAQDAAGIRGLRAAEAQRGQAQTQQFDRYYDQHQERGQMLRGESTYSDSRDGRTYHLPHTLQPQTFHHDHGSGRDFYYNEEGNYEFADE